LRQEIAKIQRVGTENVIPSILDRPARSTILRAFRRLRGDPPSLHCHTRQFGQKLSDRIPFADCSFPERRFLHDLIESWSRLTRSINSEPDV
jgi:hypothetical protein